MRLRRALTLGLLAGALVVSTIQPASASAGPAYLNPWLPVQYRVHDLMNRMTLDDKLGQMIQPERLGITDVNTRFGGAFPAPMYAALPGRTYPELIVRMAAGDPVEPHVGEFRAGASFTRYYWQLELDERMRPTGREIVPGGPPSPGADHDH